MPLADLISTIIDNYAPEPDAAKLRSSAAELAPRICGSWVEVLPELVNDESDNTALASAIRAFAVTILSKGPNGSLPVAEGVEAYNQALVSVNSALGSRYSDFPVTIAAAVMCLLLAEMFHVTSLCSWTVHLEGLAGLMQLSRPEAYVSGIPHRLFVGARPALVVLSFVSRKASFLAEEKWRAVPFGEMSQSPVQALMSEAVAIPGILERMDAEGGRVDADAEALQRFEVVLGRLDAWAAGFHSLALPSCPLFWFQPPGDDGRHKIWFQDITAANALTHYWAFRVICLRNIARLRASSLESPKTGFLEEAKRLSVMICQSIEYLMQDRMKLFGPTSVALPLRTAHETFQSGVDQSASELQWCRAILADFPAIPHTTTHRRGTMASDLEREHALFSFKQKLIESRDWETKLKNLRLEIKDLQKEFDQTEDNIKALQSVGQIIGEVLKQLDDERFIVKASSGPRYVVGCRSKVDKAKMKQGTRVALDMTTLTIMRMLPREVDPLVYNMSLEDPGQVSFAGIGGLNDQIRELREVIELPLKNPELFLRVGIKPPKGVLLYGPPGTGKTLLARAVASSLETNFLKVVSSAIVDKYIGESARLIREMFGYAKEHEPCIIFMDEIDAIGGRRFSEGTSADREIQRTLMELLNQLDGFDYLGKTKIIMATNRPDTLDPALLRAGRLDRKIEIPLPNEVGRLEILKIHAAGVAKDGEIDFESVVKMSDGLNGADLRNVVTEAGLFAIKDNRDAINQDDFNKAVRKLGEAKKLEGKLEYQKL
ncbi:P-loop containing nucleoside triphosphate hydrolase protein [Staphylotrichum tortipilum]|uniref:P-loop containing nucleoside triphosphate hydrolase protein n=1 Tax=Staphylotrichum tortipilum TaxID=2831512 RepID=A0AAN6RT56_9PEZI|nr:P-loop containing nucleoside triphosphate hydrolase protein [Staphylotrichum longicolle]